MTELKKYKIWETCESTITYIVEAKNEDDALEKHQEDPDKSWFMRQDYGNCDFEVEEEL